MNTLPRSECTYARILNISNKLLKHLITLEAEASGQGKEIGNLGENSSANVKMYAFLLLLRRGPLKSTLSLSNGIVALITWLSGGL